MKENVAYVGEVVNSEITEALKKNETVSAKVMDFPKTEYALLRERQLKQDRRYGYAFAKRAFDIIVSLISIIILLPLFAVVSIAIRIDSEGSALYKQERVGKNGKMFTFFKFRSMHKDAEYRRSELIDLNEMDGPVFKITNDPRITKVGRFLRKTSIDELPQLFNILKGEMSFVGPRPPLPGEVEQYNDYQNQRLIVKGGLTCYWQISGRNNLSFNEWVRLDIKYIDERNFFIDIMIILKTFKAVFKGKGAY